MYVFLFTDIEGSSQLWEEHTEAMTGVIARHDELLRQVVSDHGGRITKHTGDGITAAFDGGSPLACALQAQVRFAAEPWAEIGALPIRVGLHAGAAEWIAGPTPRGALPPSVSVEAPGAAQQHTGDYFGPPVNATARVMSAAWGGQILLTPQVTQASSLPDGASLLDLGHHLLKNVTDPQQLYQLDHPQLPRHQFPPPRTLSGQSIRQAVEQRGGQLATLEPGAMGIALLATTLLPTLLGDPNPESGALEGNLGVLQDLGALSLRGFVARFAQRLRVDKPLPARELQALLQDELQEQWQAGDQTAAALRADASRLLQAVHGVEAAMATASGEVKEALARGLADLGTQFGEFRWMLAGVQEALAEMRAEHALQLAFHREQLDLQRQQLVKTNLILQGQRATPTLAEAPREVALVESEAEEAPPAAVACPYMGLAAFEADDADYFFGREELVAELTARLAGTHFLAVVGPSGSGKSSLVRAGLLPAIWAGALPGSREWQTLVLTPGAHPLEELAARVSLLRGISPTSLLNDLNQDPQALHMAVRQALADEREEVKLLLVVDQFEEVFALCHDEAERRRTIDALLYAVEADEGRTIVLLTIRADFYGRCADYPGLAARLSDGLLVGPMSEEELRAAIERPAALVGLNLEAGLVPLILGDVAGEPGALPLLSHALLETFARRRGRTLTLSGYTAAGGVSGAIAQTADTVFAQLSPEQQAIARNIFLRLTELGEEGAQDTRRRVAPSELVRTPEEAEAVEGVLKTLADARLVTTGEQTVEVAHEALIREWPALRGWLEEDRDGLRIHRHLTEAAQEWQRLDRDPGELYRGARLAAATEWVGDNGQALNPLEWEFLAASQALIEQQEAEREAQRQRELEAARALAQEQQKRADVEQRRAEEQARAAGRLRRRALLLAGAMVVAILLAVAAVFAFRQATQNAQAAQAEALSRATAQAEANAAALEANQQRDVAQAEADARATQQAIAESEAQARATQQAIAETEAQARATQQAVAEQKAREALEAYSLSLVANARQVLDEDDAELALLLALAANGIEDPPVAARRALMDIAYAPATRRTFVTDEANYGLEVSPDGQRVLVGGVDGTVFLWDLNSGELLQRLEGHTNSVGDVAFSPDGRRALSTSFDKTAILWDLTTGEILHRLEGHTANVRTVAFGPDGRTALTGEDPGSSPGELILWDLETDDPAGRIIRRFGGREEEHRQGVRSVVITPDGRRALVGLGANVPHDRPLVLWDLETFQVIRFFEGPTTSVNDVALSPDGRLGVSGAASERTVSVWDLETGEELHRLEGHEGLVVGVAFSPDGRTVLSSDTDGVVIWWDLDTGEPIRHLRGHTDTAWDVDFVDDTRAVSSAHDGTLRLWDLTTAWQLDHWQGEAGLRHGAAVTALAISPDGHLALSGAGSDEDLTAADHSLILWDYESGQPLRRLEGHRAKVSGVVFSPDGRQALSGSFDGTLILWDLDTGEVIRQLEGHMEAVAALDISADGRHALSSSCDATIILWDLRSGNIVRRFTGHQAGCVTGVAFGPDNRQAVSSAHDGSLIVWDLASGQRVRRLTGITSPVGGHLVYTNIEGMALSPDGRTALSVGWTDQALVLWDLASGQSIRRFAGHTSPAKNVAVSPDGRTAISGGMDDSVIQWDLATGTPLRRFPVTPAFQGAGSGYYSTRVAIHPDGATALSSEPDGTILKWQLAEPSPVELIAWIGQNRPLRDLTCVERETYQIAPFCDDDGVSAATTADLLDTAAASAEAAAAASDEAAASATASTEAAAAAAVTPEPTPASATASAEVAVTASDEAAATLPTPAPRPTLTASLGDNRGDLARYEYDVWTYDGQAGEVLTLHMQADHPLTRWIPFEERFDSGLLDSFLTVTAPDGSMLAFADDAPSREDWATADSLIEAVYLPADGQYRIEASSLLDDLAGGYTLAIESRQVDIDPAVLQSYAGRYEAPWGDVVTVSYQEGRLDYLCCPEWPSISHLDPISETEFVRNPAGARVVFKRDDDGFVSGLVLIDDYGAYEHVRLEE